MGDMEFRHVILEFPTACSTSLGDSFVMKFIQHYEEDLFWDERDVVITCSGKVDTDGVKDQLRLETQTCKRTLHDFRSIVTKIERFSDEVVPFEKGQWPLQICEAVLITDMSGDRMPGSIVLSLHGTLLSGTVQKEKYTLNLTSQAALADMKAGVHPSGKYANFLRDKL